MLASLEHKTVTDSAFQVQSTIGAYAIMTTTATRPSKICIFHNEIPTKQKKKLCTSSLHEFFTHFTTVDVMK